LDALDPAETEVPVMRTDVASMVDFAFQPGRPPGVLGDLLSGSSGHSPAASAQILTVPGASPRTRLLAERYAASTEWLWYVHGEVAPYEAPLFNERRRLCLAMDPEEAGAGADLSVLVLPQRGVGVATAWVGGTPENPWQRKHELWQEHQYRWSLFEPTGVPLRGTLDVERHYPFLSVQLKVADLAEFSLQHRDRVSAWLTGGYEHESEQRQKSEVGPQSNLSTRSYEQIFMRWTDALALYAEQAGDEYEIARLRAAQLFEYCILARRLFRSDARRIAELSGHVGLLTLPVVSKGWRDGNAILVAFTQAEFELVTAPPAASVEAQQLLDQAVERFGILELVENTRRGHALLDRRLQWIRAEWIAVLAVLAFLVNALIATLK
jgi:hypothetical protein